VYCFMWSLGVPRPIALRTSQAAPWIAKIWSISSERDLFFENQRNHTPGSKTHHSPSPTQVTDSNRWWCCHGVPICEEMVVRC
jgi:hypothetical protein